MELRRKWSVFLRGGEPLNLGRALARVGVEGGRKCSGLDTEGYDGRRRCPSFSLYGGAGLCAAILAGKTKVFILAVLQQGVSLGLIASRRQSLAANRAATEREYGRRRGSEVGNGNELTLLRNEGE